MPAPAQQPYLLMAPAVHPPWVSIPAVHPSTRHTPTAIVLESVGVFSPELLHSTRRDALATATAIAGNGNSDRQSLSFLRLSSYREGGSPVPTRPVRDCKGCRTPL